MRSSTWIRTVVSLIEYVSNRLGEGRRRLDRRRARGVLNPCARESDANREVSEGKANIWSRFVLGSQQGAANGQDFWVIYQGCLGFWKGR